MSDRVEKLSVVSRLDALERELAEAREKIERFREIITETQTINLEHSTTLGQWRGVAEELATSIRNGVWTTAHQAVRNYDKLKEASK